jgi:hypothetical protein
MLNVLICRAICNKLKLLSQRFAFQTAAASHRIVGERSSFSKQHAIARRSGLRQLFRFYAKHRIS